MSHHLPDKATMCHRTGFAKTCFECVTQHGCRLWKHIVLEGDPAGAPGQAIKPVDHWDCIDALMGLMTHDLLRRQLQTTATVDKVAEEVGKTTQAVREGNDGQMIAAMHALRLGTGMAAPMIAAGAAMPRLIEQQ